MRALRVAFAACALLAWPLALAAQQPVVQPIAPGQPPRPPHSPPSPPNQHPRPYPTGGNGHRPPYTTGQWYPYVTINANSYLATPTPKPAAKHTHAPHANGQDVFEIHSSEDAK